MSTSSIEENCSVSMLRDNPFDMSSVCGYSIPICYPDVPIDHRGVLKTLEYLPIVEMVEDIQRKQQGFTTMALDKSVEKFANYQPESDEVVCLFCDFTLLRTTSSFDLMSSHLRRCHIRCSVDVKPLQEDRECKDDETIAVESNSKEVVKFNEKQQTIKNFGQTLVRDSRRSIIKPNWDVKKIDSENFKKITKEQPEVIILDDNDEEIEEESDKVEEEVDFNISNIDELITNTSDKCTVVEESKRKKKKGKEYEFWDEYYDKLKKAERKRIFDDSFLSSLRKKPQRTQDFQRLEIFSDEKTTEMESKAAEQSDRSPVISNGKSLKKLKKNMDAKKPNLEKKGRIEVEITNGQSSNVLGSISTLKKQMQNLFTGVFDKENCNFNKVNIDNLFVHSSRVDLKIDAVIPVAVTEKSKNEGKETSSPLREEVVAEPAQRHPTDETSPSQARETSETATPSKRILNLRKRFLKKKEVVNDPVKRPKRKSKTKAEERILRGRNVLQVDDSLKEKSSKKTKIFHNLKHTKKKAVNVQNSKNSAQTECKKNEKYPQAKKDGMQKFMNRLLSNNTLSKRQRRISVKLKGCTAGKGQLVIDDRNDIPTFPCLVCKLRLHLKSDFIKHILTHRSLKEPFQCMNCGLCFDSKAILKRHLKNVHRIHNFVTYLKENNVK